MQTKNIIFYTTFFLCTNIFAAEIHLQAIDVNAEAELLEDTITKKSASLAKEAKGETLGDFLGDEQFIDSASYGPAVGRPVVRGMDGYRVGITNGNIDLNDLSAMSQDHAVGLVPRASEKIEIIKGPASLLYGNYSGGVVRVLGEEHEKKLLKQGYSLDTTSSYGTNGAGLVLGGTVNASDYNVSISANTFYHDSSNYKDGNGNEVKDTDSYSLESHVVLGYQFNANNILKLYIDEMEKNYGIPNSTLAATTIEMTQERYGLVWHNKNLFDVIRYMQTEIQSSDYLHSELEGERADGLFSQKQFSVSTMLEFDIEEWMFKANAEYQNSELKVCHDHGKCTKFYDAARTGIDDGVALQQNIDRFGLPYAHGHPMPNISESSVKTGLLSSYFLDDDNELKIAINGEFREISPDSVNIPEVWLVTASMNPTYYDTKDDFALSSSLGIASFVNNNFSFEGSLSYIERLPSSTELYWNGFHHATDTYIFGDVNLDNERSFNVDIDTVIKLDDFTTKIGTFYYYFLNYIYQDPLADDNGNLLIDPFHQSDVWAIKGVGASVYGLAIKESYKKKLGANIFDISLDLQAIRGTLHSGGNLPRIPTLSSTLELEHKYKSYTGNISYKYVDESRFDAKNETQTPAYSWVSALISYEQKIRYLAYSIYLKGENLTDEMAYNHLSFLKETAPLPGRQVSVGLDLSF